MNGLRPCDACCGTGEPSPWEYDYFVWKSGVPHAVCGGCRGSGLLGALGFRLGQSRTARLHAGFHADPASLVHFLRRKASVDTHAKRGDSTQIEAPSPMGSAVPSEASADAQKAQQ